ncbi:MAG: T9SS type A sorting domain-containing protein [Bacteroidota bacterium]
MSKLAGSGVSLGFSGDGANANDALLYNPYATAVDKMGNVYIADYLNHRIRKIDTLGIITTIAGSGTISGYAGDGALATNALLNSPNAIVVDTLGNIYFTELKNNCVRKVNTSGIISTHNNTINNPSAICIDKNQNLYVADYLNHQIKKIDVLGNITVVAGNGTIGFGGDGLLAINAQLNYPEGVAADVLGNIYVSDTQNKRIRKVATDGVITTVAGNGNSGFSGDGALAIGAELNTPRGITCDTLGNVYFADSNNNRIRKVDAQGNITTILGEIGLSESVELSIPIGVSLDAKGNLYIADTFNSAVQKLTAPITPTEETTAIKSTIENTNGIVVYPNPTMGEITIRATNNSIENIKVYNVFAQEVGVKFIEKQANVFKLDISEDATGLYFVHTKTDLKTEITKINLVKR